jgi:hypothetical protein
MCILKVTRVCYNIAFNFLVINLTLNFLSVIDAIMIYFILNFGRKILFTSNTSLWKDSLKISFFGRKRFSWW